MKEQNSKRCKANVWVGFHTHQCLRIAWKDGYCKQHHPDNVKQRQEESMARYEEKEKQHLPYKLEQAKQTYRRIGKRNTKTKRRKRVNNKNEKLHCSFLWKE